MQDVLAFGFLFWPGFAALLVLGACAGLARRAFVVVLGGVLGAGLILVQLAWLVAFAIGEDGRGYHLDFKIAAGSAITLAVYFPSALSCQKHRGSYHVQGR